MINGYYAGKMKRKLKELKNNNNFISFDTKEDHNYIIKKIIIRYAFRMIRLVIILLSIGYFVGTLWYIFTWVLDDGLKVDGQTCFFGWYGFNDLRAKQKNLDA